MAEGGQRARLFEAARRVTGRSGLLRYLTPTAATAIVVLFLLASAVPLMYWFTLTGLDVRLSQSRAVWEEQGFNTYRFTVAARCACSDDTGGPVRVSVIDGEFSESMALGAERSAAATPSVRLRTMTDLFDLIVTELAGSNHRLEADFDAVYGFPRRIEIDPSAEELDDETLILVTDFDPRSTAGVGT